MLTAKRDIAVVAANHHLITSRQDIALIVLAYHHRCFLSAVADRPDFAHFVGKGEQCGRPGKQLALKIDSQAKGHDRHFQVIDGAGQLPDLLGLKKLRLINENAGARTVFQPLGDLCK